MLTRLARALASYNMVDLLATVGALQLLPENADRTIRLEAFAHAVASLRPSNRRPAIDRQRLATICHVAPLGEGPIASAEDPLNNPFTEAFAFHGGSYIVFPGIADETPFVLRHLAKAIFLRAPLRHSSYASEARDLLLAVLVLSNEIAHRAGLRRNVAPGSTPKGTVFIPRPQQLSRLKQAVSFKPAELAALLAPYGITPNVLDALVTPAGNRTFADYQLGGGPLLGLPIVRINQRYIVILPGRLLAAARHALINLALDKDVAETVAEGYREAVMGTVVESLHYLRHHLLPGLPLKPLQHPSLSEALFTCDSDMLVYVLLITDTWNDYDRQNSHSDWPFNELTEILQSRLTAVEQEVFKLQPPPNALVQLPLVQNAGRFYMFGLDHPTDPDRTVLMALSAADLETIALLEGGEPLALWKYGRAAQQERLQGKVFATSQLDEFQLYRAHDYSYYVSDESRDHLISIMPSGAGELRLEVLGERDWHVVSSYRGGFLTEVTTLFGTSDVPIYVERQHIARSGPARQATVLVEGASLPLWVTGPIYEGDTQRALHSQYAQFAETIGYWLWQFTPSLASSLDVLVARYSVLRITLSLPSDPAWDQIHDDTSNFTDALVDISCDSSEGILYVALRPAINVLLQRADNAGERELMRYLLQGLRTLLPDDAQHHLLGDDTIAVMIENHAPLGLKKKLLILDSRYAQELDDNGLPPYRKVHSADIAEVLDAVGDYLRHEQQRAEGPIPDEERTVVLREIVGFLYRELSTLVTSLDPDGLLEWLIAHHEAIVRETAFHRLTTPTRLACFGSTPNAIKRIMDEIPAQTTAAIASRFVIEYVATQPPRGQELMSLRVYDRLLALAAQIVNLGFESDLIYYQLADLKLTMLGSGRLGTDRDAYEQVLKAFQPTFATGEVSRAKRAFARHWPQITDSGEQPEWISRLDAAAQQEFGHTLTDILRVLEEAMQLADDLDPAVASLPLDALIAHMTQRLGWSDDQVEQILELLSLKPRANFLRPSAPYHSEDVYPWRFNRALSYLRRPLLYREREGTIEVLWGKRHTYTAWGNLLNLCVEGRLRAQSKAMRQLIGEFHNQRGEEFNDEVANVFAQRPEVIVRRRVKKVGRLRGQYGPPGDIDVLVADLRAHRLYVVECKDLAVARTPHEMANEVANLFQGGQGKKAIVDLHQRRVEWVQDHLADILAWLGCAPAEVWTVEALIVVDQELMGPYLQTSPIPIVSIAELELESEMEVAITSMS